MKTKRILTTEDFDEMQWHDVTVHAIAFRPERYELGFDIDYIYEWRKSDRNSEYFEFVVAPATLVFRNLHDFELDLGAIYSPIQIQTLTRSDPQVPPNADYIAEEMEWLWEIDLDYGFASFRSVGFSLTRRMPPVVQKSQTMSLSDRGGIKIEFDDE